MLAVEGLKEGTRFLAKYNTDMESHEYTFEEFKVVEFSRSAVKLEMPLSNNTYDNKVRWFSTEDFAKNYVIIETLKG
jgi:hypothetical protein